MVKAKHAPMSAKALSQRLKWRGLQKLKFYCQLCEKQMRDDNGFKCHMMSEAHQRNLLIAAESPEKYIKEYSELFHRDYMALLKRRWGTTRVHANVVYCEYVAHKTHYHMNATQWTTLTQYAQWLGEKGYCKVDYQDDGPNRGGWYVQYIDCDPELERRKKELERLARKQQDLDEKHNNLILAMVEKDKDKRDSLDQLNDLKPGPEKLDIKNHEKLTLQIPTSTKIANKYKENMLTDGSLGFKSLVAQMVFKTSSECSVSFTPKAKKISNLEQIMLENEAIKKNKLEIFENEDKSEEENSEEEKEQRKEEKRKVNQEKQSKKFRALNMGLNLKTVGQGEGIILKKNLKNNESSSSEKLKNSKRSASPISPSSKSKSSKSSSKQTKENTCIDPDDQPPWLHESISVKVTTKALGAEYYKKKGKILKVIDEYEALVSMYGTNSKIKIDQSYLETIIPAIDRDVLVLTGKYSGRKANLKKIHTESGTVSVELYECDKNKSKFVPGLKYDMISKLVE